MQERPLFGNATASPSARCAPAPRWPIRSRPSSRMNHSLRDGLAIIGTSALVDEDVRAGPRHRRCWPRTTRSHAVRPAPAPIATDTRIAVRLTAALRWQSRSRRSTRCWPSTTPGRTARTSTPPPPASCGGVPLRQRRRVAPSRDPETGSGAGRSHLVAGLADPSWKNLLDPSYARERGGRWNPPGSTQVRPGAQRIAPSVRCASEAPAPGGASVRVKASDRVRPRELGSVLPIPPSNTTPGARREGNGSDSLEEVGPGTVPRPRTRTPSSASG